MKEKRIVLVRAIAPKSMKSGYEICDLCKLSCKQSQPDKGKPAYCGERGYWKIEGTLK